MSVCLLQCNSKLVRRSKDLESGAEYVILSVDYDTPNDYPNSQYTADQYNDNADFETEADAILDFSEGKSVRNILNS